MFLVVLVVIAFNYMDRGTLSVAMPMIRGDLKINAFEAGVILSAFSWSYALMQLPGGWLVDRLGPRSMITGMVVAWGAVQAATALAFSVGPLIALRVALGIAEGPGYTAGARLIANWLPPEDRGRGATILDTGSPLGIAIGGLLVGLLIGAFGSWRPAFVIVGVLTFLLSIFTWRFLRDYPSQHAGVSPAELAYIEAHRKAEVAEEQVIPQRRNFFRFLRFRSFWAVCLGSASYSIVNGGLLTWGPSYLVSSRHLHIALAGVTILIIFGVGVIGELIGGQICDRWRHAGAGANQVYRTLFTIAGVLAAIGLVAVAYVPSAVAAVALLSAVLFFLRWTGLYWAVPSMLTDQHNVGLLGGIMNFTANILGGLLTPIVVGAVVQQTGSFFLPLIGAAVCSVCFVIFSLLIDYEHKIPV